MPVIQTQGCSISISCRRRAALIVVTCLIALSLAAPVTAAASGTQAETSRIAKAPSCQVYPAVSEIRVDGVLDEEAWARAGVLKLPFEYTPGDNVAPPVETDCLVTFDAERLYVAFRAFDPEPGKIRAHLMDRDATDILIQDDHISIIVDPFNDERRGFQFRVNPLGVQADANFSELEGYEDFSWDAIWASAGRIEDWGYAIELAIPFSQLRFPRTGDVQTWGFSAERSWPRSVRHRIASHRRDRNVACILCQVNKLTGFQGMAAGRNMEFDPTVTAARTDVRDDFPAGPMTPGRIDAEPGLSARWGITPNLVLNAALNPDFSQIEADVAQLDVNTRFALYYPEKRPFFLEGADLFLTPIEAIFTRTVADPAGGLKFTGKSGRNAFGFFGTYDRINNLLLPSNQGSASAFLDDDVTGGVFRFRRDIGRNSTVGLLYTGRSGDGYFNHVVGTDGFVRLSRTTALRMQYLHTETAYPDALSTAYGQPRGSFGGDGATAGLQHFSRNWVGQVEAGYYTSGFRADFGFKPQVDLRSLGVFAQRVVWGRRGGWFDRIGLGVQARRDESLAGRLTEQQISSLVQYQGRLQSQLTLMGGAAKEYFSGHVYDLGLAGVQAEMKPFSGFALTLGGRAGDAVDYTNARKSSVLNLTPGVEYNFGRHVNFRVAHAFERLGFGGREVYTANLSQLRFVYNFNVRTFMRIILQYRRLARDPDLYLFPVSETSQTVFTQVLFSYKLNPQTVLFLGYADNAMGLDRVDVTRTDRTFFVKLGYAWLR